MDYITLKKIRDADEEQLANVALKLAAEQPDLFLRLLTENSVIPFPVHRETGEYLTTVQLTDADIAKIREAGKVGKISAIKELRTLTGIALLEAKLLVEKQNWFKTPERGLRWPHDY